MVGGSIIDQNCEKNPFSYALVRKQTFLPNTRTIISFGFYLDFFLKMLWQQYLELDLFEQMQFICYFIQLCASLTLREILSNCSVYFKILSNFTDCQRNIVQMQHQIIHCQRKWNVAIFSCFSRISPPGVRNWKCIQKGAIKVLYFLQVRE